MHRRRTAPGRRAAQRPAPPKKNGRPVARQRRPADPTAPPAPPRVRRRQRHFGARGLAALALAGTLLVAAACLVAVLVGGALIYGSGSIVPGVSAAGVDLGGLSEAEAEAALASAWSSGGLLLRDGDRTWAVLPADLGIALDAGATAAAARDWGRAAGGPGGLLRAITSGVAVDPVLSVDLNRLQQALEDAKLSVDLAPVNAGVRLVNGEVIASPAQNGRTLDSAATMGRVAQGAAPELADGALDLAMVPVAPAIADASVLVSEARALLSRPFEVRAYDPVRDEWQSWSAPPDVWATWLSAESAPDAATGLSLTVHSVGPQQFLETAARFSDERYIKPDEAVEAIQQAARRGETVAAVRAWHQPTTHTVRPGQTLAAIGEEVGIPYPYIQAANPGVNVDALSVGQTLQIPSRDELIPLDPIATKRIVISRSQQHLWAYENGQVVFDWVISTGLPTSPTALGIFQVQTHELNAYAAQWNLYMPHFMGFYHPGPNMDLINGFHGFPTRGGGYLLWTGDLGRPVTYGCVLLSLENAAALYNWAPAGVIVEVRA